MTSMDTAGRSGGSGALRVALGVVAFVLVTVAGIVAFGQLGDPTVDPNTGAYPTAANSFALILAIALLVGATVTFALEKIQTGRLDSLSRQFTLRVIVLMPFAIAINIVLGQTVAAALKIPIYLDSIGTILVGVLAGPVAGAATGFLANVLWSYVIPPPFQYPPAAAFAIVAAVIGIAAGLAGCSSSPPRVPSDYDVVLKRPLLTDFHWVYLLDEHFRVNRVSEQKNVSPHMVPPDRTVLCVELSLWKDEPLWNASDEEIYRLTMSDLMKMGYGITEDEVEQYHVTDIPTAYPVYELNFEDHLIPVLEGVHSLDNLLTLGRHGLFLNNSMDDNVLLGIKAEMHALEERLGDPSIAEPEHDAMLARYSDLQDRFRLHDGYAIELKTATVLHGLGFSTHDFERPTETFSGGWQMRIALAKLLLRRPNLLLLDELDRVLDARGRVVAVVERHHRDRAPVHAAALVDVGVAGLRAAVELDPQPCRGPPEGGAHADPDVFRIHAGSAGAAARGALGPRGQTVVPDDARGRRPGSS